MSTHEGPQVSDAEESEGASTAAGPKSTTPRRRSPARKAATPASTTPSDDEARTSSPEVAPAPTDDAAPASKESPRGAGESAPEETVPGGPVNEPAPKAKPSRAPTRRKAPAAAKDASAEPPPTVEQETPTPEPTVEEGPPAPRKRRPATRAAKPVEGAAEEPEPPATGEEVMSSTPELAPAGPATRTGEESAPAAAEPAELPAAAAPEPAATPAPPEEPQATPTLASTTADQPQPAPPATDDAVQATPTAVSPLPDIPPTPKDKSVHPATLVPSGARGRRVVVAEDEALIRLDVVETLNEAGFEVVGEAGDGEKAVALASELKPDVVVMDIKMPILDGISAAERIGRARVAPVVLLTAFSQAELVERARDAGAMAYVVKPFTPVELLPAIEIAIARHQEITALEAEVADLAERFETRKRVERAKGLLMTKMGLTEPESFRWIQKTSMDRRLTMREVADAVIEQVGGSDKAR